MNNYHLKGEDGIRHSVDEIVINWHITEACNYRCQYCYATWIKPDEQKEVYRNKEQTQLLLKDLWRLFDPNNLTNPLRKHIDWKSVRLSIAGGEPTLLKNSLGPIVAEAKHLGFNVSLITNGSLLDEALISRIAPNLSILGISFDSANITTNKLIGRIGRQNNSISVNELNKVVSSVRRHNPKISIKVNTVVNSENASEDMNELIRKISPDRWKVLRVLPVISERLKITDGQFQAFIARHQDSSDVMSAEDNIDMTESYIMVDPHGRFFQNSPGAPESPYATSPKILGIGAEAAFLSIQFSARKFAGRYKAINLVKVPS